MIYCMAEKHALVLTLPLATVAEWYSPCMKIADTRSSHQPTEEAIYELTLSNSIISLWPTHYVNMQCGCAVLASGGVCRDRVVLWDATISHSFCIALVERSASWGDVFSNRSLLVLASLYLFWVLLCCIWTTLDINLTSFSTFIHCLITLLLSNSCILKKRSH